MIDLSRISTSKIIFSLVAISVFYFLIKGFQYLLIGSYVPILFILLVMGVLAWSYGESAKKLRRAFRFWAFIIVAWATIRLGLWIYLQVDTNFTESHLREQFGTLQNGISLLMLLIGILIFVKIKKLKLNTSSNQ